MERIRIFNWWCLSKLGTVGLRELHRATWSKFHCMYLSSIDNQLLAGSEITITLVSYQVWIRLDFSTSKHFKHRMQQEPITMSLQLPHIPVTAFSQTDLFLVWISLEFRYHRNLSNQLQSLKRSNVDISTCAHEVALFYPYRSVLMQREWNWPISREKHLTIDWSVKMPLHWLIMGHTG